MSLDSEIWQERLKEWKKSGMTQKEFCEKYKWNLTVFGYWKRKLIKKTKDGLVEITSKDPHDDKKNLTEPVFVITVNGVSVKFGMNMRLDKMTAIIKALKEMT